MNKKQLKEPLTVIGTLVEMSLLLYRSSAAAKAVPEEAMRTTQVFIVVALNGGKNDNKEGV